MAKDVVVALVKSDEPVSVVDARMLAKVELKAPEMVDEPNTESDPVVVAEPLMVVEPTETRPPLKVNVVDVAFEGNKYAKF
jgi:hypothetical protein